MKRIPSPFLLLLLAAAAATSCSERIDIDTSSQQAKLAVNAFISAEASQQTVWLSKTSSYFEGISAVQAVAGARVWIDDVELTPNDTAPGQYLTPPNFSVAAGKQSFLRVLYDLDGDGTDDEFTATETMRDSVRLDRLVISPMMDTAKYVPPFGVAVIFRRNMADDCFSGDVYYGSPKGRRNMYRYIGNYGADRVPHGTYGEQVMFNFTFSSSVTYAPGDTLRLCPFDTIRIRMNSIPRSTLDYVNAAAAEAGGSNPMFGGPPANVPFNIAGSNAVGCFALRNPSRWLSFVLPMNLKTLEGTWTAQDGSGTKITIDEHGTATYANGASKGAAYFTGVKVDADIRGFRAKKGDAPTPQPFQMESYSDFLDIASEVMWRREQRGFF